jgi:hypothetical protein
MTDLSEKVIARADSDSLSSDHPLRIQAAAFDKAPEGFCADPQTFDVKTFVRHWARLRRTWCDYSGEERIPGFGKF